MKDFITYKDYIGSVHFNAQDEVFFGKIEGIDDLISFEGKTVIELKKAFEEAVNDYVKLCKEAGKDNEKSYKGSFNVRISSEVHRKAKRLAIMSGMSLNQFIQKAVEEEVKRESVNSNS
jgi:predicted HicB family RNase H-like nuclease